MAKKKVSSKKSSSSKVTMSDSKKSEDMLCKISLVMAVFFVMTVLPSLTNFILSVRWWVWLVLAVIIGWKPLKRCCMGK